MVGNSISRIIPEEFKSLLFLLSFCIYILVESTQRLGYLIPFIHSYLNDLVCMPIILALAQFLERIIKRTPELIYDQYKIVATFFLVSVSFELILPLTSNKYTADVFDCFAYAIGSWAYFEFVAKGELKKMRLKV